MRGVIACIVMVISLTAFNGTPASAARKPPAPLPPAQGTITLTYSGSGSQSTAPGSLTTIGMEYREVLQVTSGTYDKAAGTMDLRGTGTASLNLLRQYDGTFLNPYPCIVAGTWSRTETTLRRGTYKMSGVYNTDSHRKVKMSGTRQGTMDIGHYPGPTSTTEQFLPRADETFLDQYSTHFEGENPGCVDLPPICSPPRVLSCRPADVSRSSYQSWNRDTPFPDFYTGPPPAVPVTLDRKGHLKGTATFVAYWGAPGSCCPGQAAIPIIVDASVDVVFGAGLIADPGGPYVPERGQSVTLDASRSRTTDGVAITSYAWSWLPDTDCPQTTILANTTAPATASPTRAIVPLCSLEVTLRVTDAKRRVATAKTYVMVRPREGPFAVTPVTSVSADGIPAPWGGDAPPLVAGFVGGVNVANCANPPPAIIDSPWICPAPTGFGSGTWRGNGYDIGDVVDPGGPFHGFAWITSTQLVVDRAVYINRYLRPGGPSPSILSLNFYDANTSAGYLVDAFLAAVEAHEGDGTATNPLGGHTGALKHALTQTVNGAPLDPRRRIERLIAPNQTTLTTMTDTLLIDNERALCEATSDPLPIVWSGTILLWDAAAFIPGWVAKPITAGGEGQTVC